MSVALALRLALILAGFTCIWAGMAGCATVPVYGPRSRPVETREKPWGVGCTICRQHTAGPRLTWAWKF